MGAASDFKFGMRIHPLECKPKNAKVGQKGAWSTSRDLLLYFWDSLYISGTDKVRNFKFGVQADRRAFKPKKQK